LCLQKHKLLSAEVLFQADQIIKRKAKMRQLRAEPDNTDAVDAKEEPDGYAIYTGTLKQTEMCY